MAWRVSRGGVSRRTQVWSPGPPAGRLTRVDRFIGGGPGPVFKQNRSISRIIDSLVCYRPLARPSSSRPRAADGQCGSLTIESTREKRSRRR